MPNFWKRKTTRKLVPKFGTETLDTGWIPDSNCDFFRTTVGDCSATVPDPTVYIPVWVFERICTNNSSSSLSSSSDSSSSLSSDSLSSSSDSSSSLSSDSLSSSSDSSSSLSSDSLSSSPGCAPPTLEPFDLNADINTVGDTTTIDNFALNSCAGGGGLAEQTGYLQIDVPSQCCYEISANLTLTYSAFPPCTVNNSQFVLTMGGFYTECDNAISDTESVNGGPEGGSLNLVFSGKKICGPGNFFLTYDLLQDGDTCSCPETDATLTGSITIKILGAC